MLGQTNTVCGRGVPWLLVLFIKLVYTANGIGEVWHVRGAIPIGLFVHNDLGAQIPQRFSPTHTHNQEER